MTAHDAARRREDLDSRVAAIAALGEPVRRALYLYVVAQAFAVGRDQAAEGAAVPRHVAKFHLDKLVDDGLLDVEFRRPPGRGGPGAGRPAKLYRRSTREVEVSLPDRRYDLAGRLLAQAVMNAAGADEPVAEVLALVARHEGVAVGRDARARLPKRPSARALTEAGCKALAELGYEPRPEAGGVSLANCPFHALAAEYAELVCSMNHALLAGVLDGLGHRGLGAYLEPAEGMCCVRLRKRSPDRAGHRGGDG